MDRGAHFYKTDFQVHTPRDEQWQGDGAVSDEERREYANAFVKVCRERGVQAVAITDHHDVAFFDYIREAALIETDDKGKPLAPENRLVVFPGIELTLAIPCQALVIFDADFPVALLPQALTTLGITPSDPAEAKHAKVKKLDIMSFETLYDTLNKLAPLKDRFIVLPHVGDRGHKTLLRKDFEKHYISMPCVGGYVDGNLPKPPKGEGMLSITAGKDKNWGNKPIGLFQTSDGRDRDFNTLGDHVTWVKWAKPTAEALRQACLARYSRISHVEPTLPPIEITRIEVSNSKFLGPIGIDLNPQYNAIIGGRGTGKSTILEYIRWALCDQPPSSSEDTSGEVADFHRRREALIDGTLLPLSAVVDITFLLNGVSHVVRRKASGELTLRIGDGEFQECSEHNVRELLPIRAYSQKQLSSVGSRLDELKRFVRAPIQVELDAIAEAIAQVSSELTACFGRVVRFREIQAELQSHSLERQSLTEQIEKLRSSLKGLSDADGSTISAQSKYEAESRVVQTLEREALFVKDALASLREDLELLPTPFDGQDLPENGPLLSSAYTALKSFIDSVNKSIGEFETQLEDSGMEGQPLGAYFEKIGQWKTLRQTHQDNYEKAKSRAISHEETLRQIKAREERLRELNETADEKSQKLSQLKDPVQEFVVLRSKWFGVFQERADLLSKQCENLTAIEGTRLRATLRRAGDIEPLEDDLKQILRGTKVRGERIENLVSRITKAGAPLTVWSEILDELQALAWLKVGDETLAKLPSVPHLDGAGFTQKEKVAVARQLTPNTWLPLLLFDLNDIPVFEYEVRKNDFLPFEKASPGQQATALLSILLLQEGPPLIIDQPEDDLNMRIINDIVETLWRAKVRRQIIFTSHNANLVVNGDAELVICCDYRTNATESGGRIKLAGAIDMPEINREIAEVMEGGVEAFKLRYQKYGF